MENRLIKVAKRLASLWKASRQLRVGLLLFLGVLLVAILAGVLSPYDPYYLGDDLLMPPGSENHPLGTDHMGHDVLSMILHGSRTSLTIGIVSALISGLIGTMLGAFAGYFGGALDKITSEVINIFLMIPTFFLVLIIVSIFGSNMFNVMLVIGLTSWPSNARMMRVQAMSLKERTYIKGAVVMGESRLRILFKYIIPNGLFPVIANTTMGVAKAILTEASLSFLGLGDPNIVSWGQMVYDGKAFLQTGWWISTLPVLSIMMIVVIFYMIGDGLNDTPALSEADAGIAINTGAAIAREIADITISSQDLFELVTLRRLSEALMGRIDRNYRFIVSFNLMLIILGVTGVIQPTLSALLHNMSTLGISLRSMTNLLPEKTEQSNA